MDRAAEADAPLSAARSDPERPVARQRLSTAVKVAYAAPTLATAGMAVPIFIYMNKFYADAVLVPLGTLALAIAVARAFDAITDPLMGWLSDRTRTRWGRRRPWFLLGAPLAAMAYFALFSSPASLDGAQAGVWFGASFLLYFVFHTVFVIPHNALGPELTLDYHERSNLFGWREAFVLVGTISGALLPGLLEGVRGAPRPAYSAMAGFYAVLFVVLSWVMFRRVHERPDFTSRPTNAFVPGVRRALRNRPFRILLGSYVVGSVTAAIPGTLLPFFIAYVVRPGNDVFWITLSVVAHFVAALAAIGFWVRGSRRHGKKPVWLATILISIVSLGLSFFLREGDVVIGMLLFAAAGVAFGGTLFLTPSIQADVIDYDELHTGRRREAQYGALWALLPKLLAIPGAAIPLSVIGAMGYRPNEPQSAEVVFAIRVCFAVVPVIFSMLSLLIATRFPITEAIHREIQQGIECHQRGESARDPLTGAWLPAPGRREVDEEVGWLLDHHSPGALRRAVRRGPASLVRDAVGAGLAALALTVGAVVLAVTRIENLETAPGPLPVIAIVVAGVALSATVFHGLRIAPASRLLRAPVGEEVLRAQLRAISLEAGAPTEDPA